LIKALKALSLAFSLLSCSISFSICSISLSICSLSLLTSKISFSISLVCCSIRFERCLLCSISSSIPRTGRQLSVDKHRRHRGNDEGDAPLLLEADGAAGEGDVVIRGKEGNQAENQAAAGLDGTEVIEPGPGALWCS